MDLPVFYTNPKELLNIEFETMITKPSPEKDFKRYEQVFKLSNCYLKLNRP